MADDFARRVSYIVSECAVTSLRPIAYASTPGAASLIIADDWTTTSFHLEDKGVDATPDRITAKTVGRQGLSGSRTISADDSACRANFTNSRDHLVVQYLWWLRDAMSSWTDRPGDPVQLTEIKSAVPHRRDDLPVDREFLIRLEVRSWHHAKVIVIQGWAGYQEATSAKATPDAAELYIYDTGTMVVSGHIESDDPFIRATVREIVAILDPPEIKPPVFPPTGRAP